MRRPAHERGAAKPGLVVLVVVLVAGAAAAGALLARPRDAKPKLHPAVVPLGSFVVNLDPADGFRYLKVTLALRVHGPLSGEALKEAAAEEKFRWQDVVVRHLTGRRYADLRSAGGRERLERELVERLNEGAQTPLRVDGVYFSELVAQ
jgi:flagellar basal body-associated protein FliL